MPRLHLIALACVLCANAACSQTDHASAPPASSAAATYAATSASDDNAAGKDASLHDCAKWFTPADAASLFTVPVKVSDYGPAGGMCSFDTARGASIVLSRGTGMLSENQWKEQKANTSYESVTRVGDEALSLRSNASIVFSRKGSVYCSAQLFGFDSSRTGDDIAKQSSGERAKALGALCNKAYAAP